MPEVKQLKAITVAEAMEQMKKFPPDYLFLTDACDDGFDSTSFKYAEVEINPKRKWPDEWQSEFNEVAGGTPAIVAKRVSN